MKYKIPKRPKKVFNWGTHRKLMITQNVAVKKRSFRDSGVRFYNRSCYDMPYTVCDKHDLNPFKNWMYECVGGYDTGESGSRFNVFTWRYYKWIKIIRTKEGTYYYKFLKPYNSKGSWHFWYVDKLDVHEKESIRYLKKPKPYCVAKVKLMNKGGEVYAYWISTKLLKKQVWWKQNCVEY